MVEIAYADVGEEYQHNEKNIKEIFPGELRRSGTCNQIRIDISSTRHLGHRILVRGSGEYYSQNLFASSFLRKDKNPLPRRRSFKYDAGQEIRTGTTESSDARSVEVLKLHTREHITGTGRDGRRGVLQCQPPLDLK